MQLFARDAMADTTNLREAKKFGLTPAKLPSFGLLKRLEVEQSLCKVLEPIKNAGNLAFRSGDMQAAVKQYTSAVETMRGISPFGPDSGRFHAVLLANRAQCFVAMRCYEDALTDCLAIIDEIPSHLGYATPAIRAKALCRMALAFKGLGENAKARDAALRANDQGISVPGLETLMTSLDISLHSARKDLKISEFFVLVVEAAKGSAEARGQVVMLLDAEVFRVDERDPDHGEIPGMVSALKLACDLAGTSLVKLLLQHRSQPHQRNELSRTPLMSAAKSRDVETCKLLLAAGASINAQDEDGWTALLTACALQDEITSGRTELHQVPVVEFLLLHRADVNDQAHGGQTALILACMSANKGLAACLLEHGAEFGCYLYLSADTACSIIKCLHPNNNQLAAFVQAAAASSRGWPTERESLKACAWSELLGNELREVHNQSADKALSTGIKESLAAVQQLRDVLAVLLQLCNLPCTAQAAVRSGSNPLLVLHKQLVEDMMPDVMKKQWSDAGEINEHDAMTMIAISAKLPLVHSQQRGKLCANEVPFRQLIYEPLTKLFAFAIPDKTALDCISRYSPVVEMGAGSGYWAVHLGMAGCDVIAYDIRPPIHELSNPFFCETFADVKQGEPSVLSKHEDRALLLVWPYSPEQGADHWDAECLRHYGGQTVMYVGEWEGQTKQTERFGRTSSSAFQQKLASDFICVERLKLPHWPFMCDDLTVWKRKH